MKAKSVKPATDREITSILGSADDDLVMAIRNTGASPQEVLHAFEWLNDDSSMGKAAKKVTGNIQRVYEILQEDLDTADGERA